MSEVVIGVDASTTACKVVAFDAAGRVVAEARAAIALLNPSPGAWEQDAESWWRALGEAARRVMAELGGARVVGLAVAHQRETFVVTDERGAPLGPALVWMDHRCKDEVRRAVAEMGEERLASLSGKPACTTPSLYKVMGLFAREPGLSARVGKVLDVHAFLAWRLTGRCATSLASADPMGMLDMARGDWSEELLALAGLARGQVPELVMPGALIGHVTAEASRTTGFPEGLSIYAGAGDGQAAALGAGLVNEGAAYLNLGTALVSGVRSRRYRSGRAFRTLYGAEAGSFVLETVLQGGSFTTTWLVEKLLGRRLPEALAELEAEACAIEVGSDGLMLVPYWNGVMNPYWDEFAAGILVGLRGEHGPGHLFRALYEGLAMEQRLHTDAVEAALETRIEELVVMGGGSMSSLFCQLIADVLNRAIVRAGTAEATALGSAMLVAVASGLHPSFDAAAARMTSRGEAFLPREEGRRYDALFAVYKTLYPALRASLAELQRCRR
ncbi:MAG: xylulose kinase [Myxococcales bacterium]|nr:xylulose kinase [Myxococcales bacterium]